MKQSDWVNSSTDEIEKLVEKRWPKFSDANRFAFRAGMDYQPEKIAVGSKA